jgi:hypothetical protein
VVWYDISVLEDLRFKLSLLDCHLAVSIFRVKHFTLKTGTAGSLKYWYSAAALHGVTTQKTLTGIALFSFLFKLKFNMLFMFDEYWVEFCQCKYESQHLFLSTLKLISTCG